MIQYTTPTVGVRVKDVTLDPTYDYQLTLQPIDKNSKKPIGDPMEIADPTVSVVDGSTVIAHKLTQAQSAALPIGPVEMQANWKMSDGTRGANVPVYFKVEKNLHAQEM